MYSLLRPFLFSLDAEKAHHITLESLKFAHSCGVLALYAGKPVDDPVKVCGIEFPNRVGLAAGLDKNADYIDALGALGFGFVEVGTITPKPQAGNPQPRLFRAVAQRGIVNRMGFNNLGVEHLVKNIQRRTYRGVLGVNIGKNATTPVDNALDDYLLCLDAVYADCDYITVNLSSPNTPGLRDLQFGEPLKRLLEGLKNRQQQLHTQYGKYTPLLVKIAPDLAESDIHDIAQTFLQLQIDGVIATNTTIDKSALAGTGLENEAGGLSGAPVYEKSTAVLGSLAQQLQGKIPLIGVGGIESAAQAKAKTAAGATLVQLYSGLIYSGPALVRECATALAKRTV
ncbi:MAG TPA: quinone-dependent dihydroorotate dehydrogenase [Pseudomonadales bacterium]|nr:quinone-dependent dihydroorotate dehydrogenase [Pseudomonadales bacterium]